MHPAAEQNPALARWQRRLSLAAALLAVPLVLFGGSVTTLGAGMAVDGWLVAEGHFLLFFPLESWLRDTATFVEHTHRLFGVAVGLAALGAAVAAWRPGGRGRALATLALAAVVGQGVVGGLRVLESSPGLAFLHGALAQAVFALLCLAALVHTRSWQGASLDRAVGERLRAPAFLATGVVLAQIVAGAWYRHALRPEPLPSATGRLLVHALGALLVVAAAAGLARAVQAQGRAARERGGELPGLLARIPGRLSALLVAQILLGMTAWASHRPGAVGPIEWGLSILHVLAGGLLLALCAAAAAAAVGLSPAREARAYRLEGAA